MKKILLTLVAVVAVMAGVVGMSAFEAHIINVTAHIENALNVHPDALAFGTVFPQEYVVRQATVSASDSFIAEQNATSIDYVIKQKPKCKAIDPRNPVQYVPVDRNTDLCPAGYAAMLSLCPYLSKTDADPQDDNDTSHPSYFVQAAGNVPAHCLAGVRPDATGRIDRNDLSDVWDIDLKVPPVAGTVAQDWPAGCPTVPENEKDYGCDLWIEVTGVGRVTP